jgi:hypothetical protein
MESDWLWVEAIGHSQGVVLDLCADFYVWVF